MPMRTLTVIQLEFVVWPDKEAAPMYEHIVVVWRSRCSIEYLALKVLERAFSHISRKVILQYESYSGRYSFFYDVFSKGMPIMHKRVSMRLNCLNASEHLLHKEQVDKGCDTV